MVMPRPSLSSPVMPDLGKTQPVASAPSGRKVALPVTAKRAGFARVLAKQESASQLPQTQDTGEPVDQQPSQEPPQKQGGTEQDKGKETQPSAPSTMVADVTPPPAPQAVSDMGQSESGSPPSAQAASHDEPQKTDDQDRKTDTGNDSLTMQEQSLAALMAASSQPMQDTGPAAAYAVSQSDRTASTVIASTSSSVGAVRIKADDLFVITPAAASVHGVSRADVRTGTAGSVVGQPSSSMQSVLQQRAGNGPAGLVSAMAEPAQAAVVQPRVLLPRGKDYAIKDETTLRAVDGGGKTIFQTPDIRHASVVPSQGIQGSGSWPASSVKMVGFVASAANISGTSMTDRAVAASRSVDTVPGAGGQSDSLFGLMVKTSSGGAEASFSESGKQQGGSGDGQAMAGHDSESVASASESDGKTQTAGEPSSFAGLATVLHGSEAAPLTETHSVPASSSTHDMMKPDTAEVTSLHGSALPGLTDKESGGPAGTLSMTVMTSDEAPVHVQINRSAEGLSALSLQGRDDGTTEVLQKTHHVLAKQLDEAGLHGSTMKIDVLPADSGQMAGGQEQNMPQHQRQAPDQTMGQGAGDPSSFQMGGSFAGGDGSARQGPQTRQAAAFSGVSQQDTAPWPDEQDGGTAEGSSGRTGRLNISV